MYRYRTVDKLPERPSAAAVRGTLIHRVLERLFSLPATARTLLDAEHLLLEEFNALDDHDEASAALLRDDGVTVVTLQTFIDGYFDLEDPKRIEPQHCEVGVATELEAGFTIQGFIDRVDRSPQGLIRIVDYKTGRAPGAGFETQAMFQMRFYALVWWRLTGQIPALLQLMYLGSRDILRYEPSADELLSTERKILALRGAISGAATRGEFRPTPSKLCRWCSFQSHCPEFGNQVLPLPDPQDWHSTSLSRDHISTMLKGP